MAFISRHIYQLFDLLSQILSPFGFLGDGGNLKILKVLKNDNICWNRAEISNISALKSLGWWVVGGGWCIYDYSVNLSPNLWLMTFNLDLDLGLTMVEAYGKRSHMISYVQCLSTWEQQTSIMISRNWNVNALLNVVNNKYLTRQKLSLRKTNCFYYHYHSSLCLANILLSRDSWSLLTVSTCFANFRSINFRPSVLSSSSSAIILPPCLWSTNSNSLFRKCIFSNLFW